MGFSLAFASFGGFPPCIAAIDESLMSWEEGGCRLHLVEDKITELRKRQHRVLEEEPIKPHLNPSFIAYYFYYFFFFFIGQVYFTEFILPFDI